MSEQRKRRYFCMYSDYRPLLENLSDAQRGKLLLALYDRFDGKEPADPLDPLSNMAACAIFRQMDYDDESYATKCEKNRRNGSLGGISKRQRSLAVASDGPQEKEKKKEKQKENSITADKPPRARFIKPLAQDVEAYCRGRGNKIDAQRFIDYYEANGWKVGRNPMKDWRAAVRTWEQRDKDTEVNANGNSSDAVPDDGRYYGIVL